MTFNFLQYKIYYLDYQVAAARVSFIKNSKTGIYQLYIVRALVRSRT